MFSLEGYLAFIFLMHWEVEADFLSRKLTCMQ